MRRMSAESSHCIPSSAGRTDFCRLRIGMGHFLPSPPSLIVTFGQRIPKFPSENEKLQMLFLPSCRQVPCRRHSQWHESGRAAALASFVLCTSGCICFGPTFAFFDKHPKNKVVGTNVEDRAGSFREYSSTGSDVFGTAAPA